jgi:hypothetical protein
VIEAHPVEFVENDPGLDHSSLAGGVDLQHMGELLGAVDHVPSVLGELF